MARNDIRVWRHVEEGTAAYPLTASQFFEEGEVVVVAAAGTLSECASDPAVVTGISAASSQGKTATGIDGARPTGTLTQVYKPVQGQLFSVRAARFARDGAGTAVTPALTDVGDTAGFIHDGTNWFVDTGAANIHVEIVAVLDSNGSPLGDTSIRTVGTGATVVFGFLS